MLVTTSRATPGARALHAQRTADSRLLVRASATASIQSRHGFCNWSSGHRDMHRENRKRHRLARYQYMESLQREKPWGKTTRPDHFSLKVAMKESMIQNAQWPHATSDRSQYTNVDEIQSWSDDMSGARPGRNIEDVERDAIDHLFSHNKNASIAHAYDVWSSPLQNIRNYLQPHRAPKDVTPEEVLHATTSTEVKSGKVDPITSRKTSSDPAQQDAAPTSFTPKYEDLDDYGPSRWNEPDGLQSRTREEASKQYDDLPKYSFTKPDDPNAPRQLSAEEQSKQYDDLAKYKPIQWNEPNGLPQQTAEEASHKYTDLSRYSPGKFDDPNAPHQLTAEEKTKLYQDLGNYKPVQWNEPDGLQEPTPEERSKQYDDLGEYTAVRWNEPDGLRKLTPEELSKKYEDVDKYGPLRWSEPDGLRKLTPEEESKAYSDLATYKDPFVAKDAILNDHEARQLDSTQKGEPLPPKIEVAAVDPREQYDDLDQYGPVLWNEPDGLRKLTPEELSKNYDDLGKYGAVRWNEPDGLRKPTLEEKSKAYSDLKAYAPKEPSGSEVMTIRKHPEEASKAYDDLPEYKTYDNGDGPSRVHPEELSKRYADLPQYSAYSNNGPDQARVHPELVSKQYKDLQGYKPTNIVEASEASDAQFEGVKKYKDEFNKYDPKYFDSGPGSGSGNGSGASSGNGSGNKSAIAAETATPRTDKPTRNRFFSDFTETSIDFVDSRTASDIRAEVLRKAKENSEKEEMEESKRAQDASWDATTKDAKGTLQQHIGQPGDSRLTGNFVRDFPEEFARSWGSAYSQSQPALDPKDEPDANTTAEKRIQAEEQDEAELSSMDESFPTEPVKLETALDRQASGLSVGRDSLGTGRKADPYSTIPQGLETNYAEECEGSSTGPTFVKHYEGETPAGRTTAATTQPTPREPGSYRILAFDPTTGTVNTTETTSAVHDASSPPTPAEVLPRLSNPSVFFSYFPKMEADGFEIASGNNNVLVFRKVRQGSAAADAKPSQSWRGQFVNPIDMTGKPSVTGNFASPTGFVNYDALPAESVRRSVSQPDAEKEDSELRSGQSYHKTKPKRSFGRKLAIGTVSVVGGAYALGVLGEYFSTGGLDGLGPKGV